MEALKKQDEKWNPAPLVDAWIKSGLLDRIIDELVRRGVVVRKIPTSKKG